MLKFLPASDLERSKDRDEARTNCLPLDPFLLSKAERMDLLRARSPRPAVIPAGRW